MDKGYLQQLQFTLQEKRDKLEAMNMDTFTLNPEIAELVSDIKALEEEIKKVEKED